LREWARRKYDHLVGSLISEYQNGHSLSEIAIQFGWSISRVRTVLLKAGLTLRTYQQAGILAAPKLSEKRMGRKHRPWSAESRAKLSKSKTGKGRGFRINPKGYIEFTMGKHKGHLEHRIVIERILGRKLLPQEVVHHKDGNRQNNDSANLKLLTSSKHTQLHQDLRMLRNGPTLPYQPTQYPGISKRPRGTFFARIKRHKKKIYIGSFATIEEAKAARDRMLSEPYVS
jgi:hypothetical protein